MVSNRHKDLDKLLKEELELGRKLKDERHLLYGFFVGILASLLATIVFNEFIMPLPKNIRYLIELIILIVFLVALWPFIRSYKRVKEFLTFTQEYRERKMREEFER